MNRHEYFKKRLSDLGMYDEDADYDGAIGKAVEQLSETFSNQRHSGASAEMTVGLFNQLMHEWNTQDLK
jgi:hypothetical protein